MKKYYIFYDIPIIIHQKFDEQYEAIMFEEMKNITYFRNHPKTKKIQRIPNPPLLQYQNPITPHEITPANHHQLPTKTPNKNPKSKCGQQQIQPKNSHPHKMQIKKQIQHLPLDITPTQYSQKNTKQLGNHFLYSKLTYNQKWNDPRLKVLHHDYFYQKTILDIGCNQGILSIPIAIKYQPKCVNAIDIDCKMINKIKKNIQIFIQQNQHYQFQKQIISEIQLLPLLLQEKINKRFGQKVLQLDNKYQIRPKNINHNYLFPNNINCYAQNILSPLQTATFDCILCMNVTKWIHLAYGDQGIKKLFNNIQSMSTDGTILILESQPFSSYRKKQNLYQSYKQNYKMLLYKPQRFKDYLNKLGFQLIQKIKPTQENLLKHEILVFQKQK